MLVDRGSGFLSYKDGDWNEDEGVAPYVHYKLPVGFAVVSELFNSSGEMFRKKLLLDEQDCDENIKMNQKGTENIPK